LLVREIYKGVQVPTHIDHIERMLKDAADREILEADEVDAAVTRRRVADASLTEATDEPDSPSKNATVVEALDEYNQANIDIAKLLGKIV